MSSARSRAAVLALLFTFSALFSCTRSALAEAALPAAARILLTGCSLRFNERALQDQVRIELLSAGVHSVRSLELYADNMVLEEEPSSLATLRVTFPDCEESADEIRLGVADRKTGKHIDRALVISDVPDNIQARAIALALTELLRSEWQKLSEPEPKLKEVAQASDDERPGHLPKLRASRVVQEVEARDAREAEIAHKLRLEWLAVGHLYSQTDSGDLSTTLAISKLLTSRARLQFGGSLSGGAGQGTDARLFQATNRILIALCSRTLRPAIEVGALFEAGWASLEGNRDGRHTGPLVIASAHATLRVPVAESFEALITVQAGYVLVPMTAHAAALEDTAVMASRRLIGFSGPSIGLGVGLASWL